jgi:hypothetical protein
VVSTATGPYPSPYSVAIVGNYLYVGCDGTLRRADLSTPTPGAPVIIAGVAYSANFADGNGLVARFQAISSIAGDASGNLWITDARNHRLRYVQNPTAATPSGVTVTTVAGISDSGVKVGPLPARLNWPTTVRLFFGEPYVVNAEENTLLRVH